MGRCGRTVRLSVGTQVLCDGLVAALGPAMHNSALLAAESKGADVTGEAKSH